LQYPQDNENPLEITEMSNKLLIVDDAMIMRLRIREIATQAGWEVVGEAADGNQAIEMFRRLKPDLVTMDIVMPDMGGMPGAGGPPPPSGSGAGPHIEEVD
jgi:PleD family two-component response regulator